MDNLYKTFLKVKPTKTGKGVFSEIQIPAGSPIVEITGDRYIQDPVAGQKAVWTQIGPKHFVGGSGGVEDQLRHSCDPNCYLYVVGNRAILYSLYQIRAGMELTIDYSVTSTDTLDTWQMNCKCGSGKCRKIISGFQYLPTEVVEDYKKKNILPLFLIDKRFKGN